MTELERAIQAHLPTLEVDPGRITQVLTNILDNAMRHTPEGGHIILSEKQTEDMVELSIQDSGPGLPQEEAERIFDRFFTTAREQGGTGLGLSIVRAVADSRGGSITFDSNEHGTEFRLVL